MSGVDLDAVDAYMRSLPSVPRTRVDVVGELRALVTDTASGLATAADLRARTDELRRAFPAGDWPGTLRVRLAELERWGYTRLRDAGVRATGSTETGPGDHRSHGETRNGGPGIGTQTPAGERDSEPRAQARPSPPPGAGVPRGHEHEGRK